jgi:hypothetical protein
MKALNAAGQVFFLSLFLSFFIYLFLSFFGKTWQRLPSTLSLSISFFLSLFFWEKLGRGCQVLSTGESQDNQ